MDGTAGTALFAVMLLLANEATPSHGGNPPAASPAAISMGADGQIHILAGDGSEYVPPREKDQVSVASPILAENQLAAGWLVEFEESGSRVASSTNTVHGDPAPHYELRDAQTGRLAEKWEGDLTGQAPPWAKRLRSQAPLRPGPPGVLP